MNSSQIVNVKARGFFFQKILACQVDVDIVILNWMTYYTKLFPENFEENTQGLVALAFILKES